MLTVTEASRKLQVYVNKGWHPLRITVFDPFKSAHFRQRLLPKLEQGKQVEWGHRVWKFA